MGTKIEWSHETWNPVIGCSKISKGCKNCYAENFGYRLRNMALHKEKPSNLDYYVDAVNSHGNWTGKTYLIESALTKPFKFKNKKMIFVCSMGDLFHEFVKTDQIAQVFAIMFLNPQHIFQILTKRPDNALSVFESKRFKESLHSYCNQFHDKYIRPLEQELYFYDEIINMWPLENVWLGVTCESEDYIYRIHELLKIQAKIHFVSFEPLLSDIKIPWYDGWIPTYNNPDNNNFDNPAEPIIASLNWVIAGPETGHGKRPCRKKWIKPFFDKKNILGKNIQQYPA